MSTLWDLDHISLIPACFPVSWAYWLAQSIRQQGFGTNDLKAEAPALLHQQLYAPVETLSVASRVAVGKVSEDSIAIVFYCQDKGQEGFSNIWRNLREPGEVARECLFLCGSLVDLIERFLQAICGCQAGKVSQPCLQDQGITFGEVTRPLQKQVPVMHQGSSLGIRKPFTDLFAHRFQTFREHFEDVPLVYNQRCLWQGLVNDLMIVGIHISTHDGDLLTYCCGQTLQVKQQSGFIPISQQFYDRVMLQITQDATRFVQEIQFIDSQNANGLFLPSCLEAGAELFEEQTNRPFSQANFVGDTDKGSVQCLSLDVVGQAARAEMMLVHVEKWLKEGTTAPTTQVAPSMNHDSDALASYGQIHIALELFLVLMDHGMLAESTASRRREALRLDVDIILILVYLQNMQGWESQQIQELLSLRKELPHKFSVRVKFPVARDGRLPRLLRAICSHPTYFYDCEVMRWGKKHAAFPRIFTNIRQKSRSGFDIRAAMDA